MQDCIFCKIARKEIPAEVIWEDKDFMAFLDMSPINKGHTLVIPKKHFENLFEMPDKTASEYLLLIKTLAPKIKESLNARWVNLLVFGEEIKHTHVHILPRFNNDNFKYPPQGKYKSGEMEKIAEKIKSFL